MNKKLSTTEAMVIASGHGHKVSRVTMIAWAKKYEFGVKIGGRWFIYKERLIEFLEGEK